MSEQEKEDFKVKIGEAYVMAVRDVTITVNGITRAMVTSDVLRIDLVTAARRRRDAHSQHSGSDSTTSCREFQHAVDVGQFPSWMAEQECSSLTGCTWDNQSFACGGGSSFNAPNMLAKITLGSKQRNRRQNGTNYSCLRQCLCKTKPLSSPA